METGERDTKTKVNLFWNANIYLWIDIVTILLWKVELNSGSPYITLLIHVLEADLHLQQY